jgi:hypothetical protein
MHRPIPPEQPCSTPPDQVMLAIEQMSRGIRIAQLFVDRDRLAGCLKPYPFGHLLLLASSAASPVNAPAKRCSGVVIVTPGLPHCGDLLHLADDRFTVSRMSPVSTTSVALVPTMMPTLRQTDVEIQIAHVIGEL